MKHGSENKHIESENEAFEANLAPSEVNQETDLDSGRLQFVEELGLVFRAVVPSDLQFDEDTAVDEKIGLVEPDFDTLVEDPDLGLHLGGEPAGFQLDLHGPLIDGFKKAVPEVIVHLERGP